MSVKDMSSTASIADNRPSKNKSLAAAGQRAGAANSSQKRARISGSKMSSRGLSSLRQATVISETHLRVPVSPSKETACGMERTSEASGKSGEFK